MVETESYYVIFYNTIGYLSYYNEVISSIFKAFYSLSREASDIVLASLALFVVCINIYIKYIS